MESNEKIEEHFLKMNFFQKIWYSISKFEKYPEMAALGVKKALLYFTELILISSFIFTAIYVYYVKNVAKFDEELNFSQKMTKVITSRANMENEQIASATENMQKEKSETLIVALGISLFISLFISTLLDVFTLSVFGILTCFVTKIKMNYKAIFNMSIYALTLAIILRTVYFAITTLTTFKIKYFEIMYIAISYISLAAAIFIIKSNIIKQHIELMKIIEESKEKIEETFNINKKPKEKEDEDQDKEENEKKDEEPKEDKTEGQESNA